MHHIWFDEIAPGAFDDNDDKIVPLKNEDGEVIGEGQLEVKRDCVIAYCLAFDSISKHFKEKVLPHFYSIVEPLEDITECIQKLVDEENIPPRNRAERRGKKDPPFTEAWRHNH